MMDTTVITLESGHHTEAVAEVHTTELLPPMEVQLAAQPDTVCLLRL